MTKKQKIILKEIGSYAITILIAVGIAIFVNKKIIVNAEVPTPSMQPTIMVGDRLIINRLAYQNEDPKRGDIVMFRFPDNEKEDYLKRIIGLPNETIEIKNGKVYINKSEEPLEEPYLVGEPSGDFGPYQVPEGCYFMMGDNRDISYDSRYWNTSYVKREKIVGKAVFRLYPNWTIFD